MNNLNLAKKALADMKQGSSTGLSDSDLSDPQLFRQSHCGFAKDLLQAGEAEERESDPTGKAQKVLDRNKVNFSTSQYTQRLAPTS